MAVAETVELLATQTWQQLDIRDPLGLWGARHRIVGTGDGGSVKTTILTPTGEGSAFVYQCMAVNVAILDVVQIVDTVVKCRLLCNWPNFDSQIGVQSFATARFSNLAGSSNFTQPVAGTSVTGAALINPNDRFILLYDPRPAAGQLSIIELEISDNILNTDYTFEAYGYYWDRSVMNAPGGPRHPSSA